MLLSIHLPVSCSLSFKPSCVAIWQSIQPLTWHDLANMNIARRTSSATPAYHWIAIPCHSQRSQNCFPYYLQHEAQWYLGDNGTAGLLGVFETHLSSNSSDPFYAENRFMWPEVMDSRFPDDIHCLNDLFLRKFHRSGCWIRRDKGVCRLCLPPKMWILVNILYIIFYLQDLRSLVIGSGNLKHLFMFFYTFFFLAILPLVESPITFLLPKLPNFLLKVIVLLSNTRHVAALRWLWKDHGCWLHNG
jgi:hypothetical protein